MRGEFGSQFMLDITEEIAVGNLGMFRVNGIEGIEGMAIAGFAVGQRHGLGLPPQKPEAPPLFVVDKRPDGTIVVGPHEALRATRVQLRNLSWIGAPPAVGTDLSLQVRHRGKPVAARIQESADGVVTLTVLGELFAAGRGQSGVLYDGDRVLGGGIIAAATQVSGETEAVA